MDKQKQLEVKLTNQSFEGAGGSEMFPDLEMDALLFAEGSADFSQKEKAFENAKGELKRKAERRGYTHVFKVEHSNFFYPDKGGITINMVGTGYRPKK